MCDPRPSFHEEVAAKYVMQEAERLGYANRRDEAGNVVVEVPATTRMEDRPVVVLQGHLDMAPVAEPGKEHDFTNFKIADPYSIHTGVGPEKRSHPSLLSIRG